MSHKYLVLFLSLSIIGGCAGAPKNAEDFRQAMRSGPFKRTESFEVARPFRLVSDTLRKKSSECFGVAVHTTVTTANVPISRTNVRAFKPTFVGGPNKAELHIQQKRSGGGVVEVGAPADGYYRVVLDAVPAGPTRSKIDMYYFSPDDAYIRDTLRGWVTGQNPGCPDLTKR